MQPLKIPQSPMVTGKGVMASEWLVFINEFIRLCNAVIVSDTINKANDSEQNSLSYTSIALVSNDYESIHVALPASINELVGSVASVVVGNDDAVQNVAVVINQDDRIDNTSLLNPHDEQLPDNPYALLSAIKQQQYEQQIWSLNV